MAKIYGLFGAMSGKLADTVMSVRGGVQTVRKYQPKVFNPSTRAQVEVRAKLKLLSQLSAVVSPYIAIPKEGNVSSRNLFTKVNYPAAEYEDGEASINLGAVKLTDSVVGFPAVVGNFSQSTLNVNLGVPDPEISRVIYAAFVKQPDGKLRYADSVVESDPGENGLFRSTMNYSSSAFDGVVYAYGIRDNSKAAAVIFGNMEVASASDVASLIVTRRLTEADITITETRAALITSA